MAKLSDLFGRKGLAGPDKLTGRNGNGGDPISIENLSDVGSRMGEENEVLRNLLTDTGRKIGELDDLKAAFDKLVAPFNSTLRALEQEKSQTLSLSGMLAEARTAYETLRTEFYQVDRKATALEAEVEKLREDLELSREANRGLESARLELTDDLNALRAHASELDRQLDRLDHALPRGDQLLLGRVEHRQVRVVDRVAGLGHEVLALGVARHRRRDHVVLLEHDARQLAHEAGQARRQAAGFRECAIRH